MIFRSPVEHAAAGMPDPPPGYDGA
jgi:hypothetical protein